MKIDGIEVINAVTDDTFEVTQEDADNGVPQDHHKCSIALAWRRFDPVAEDVFVGKSRAYKLKDHFGFKRWIRYGVSTAIKIQEAILDKGGRLSPGIYTLKVLKGKKLPDGTQQGTDTRPDKPKSPPTLVKGGTRVITPMRQNAPTANT
jgi:hypothetical protein